MTKESQSFDSTKSSIRWNLASKILGVIVHFVSMYFLHKLIAPDIFGIIILASIITTLALRIWSLELPIVLLRDIESNETKYSTVFWATFFMGTLIFVLFYITAPILAKTVAKDGLDAEKIGFLIRMLSVMYMVLPFQIKAATELKKKLKYNVLSIIQFGSRLAVTILALMLAVRGKHLWALICIWGLMPIIQAIALTLYGRWLPKLKFDFSYIKDNFKLGGSLMFGNIIGYVSESLDQLLIGNLYGSALTAFYGKSFRLQTMPKTYIAAGISDVMIPSLIQKGITLKEQGQRFTKAGLLLAFILYPVFTIAFALAPEFSFWYFDKDWDLDLITKLVRIFSVLGLFSIFELMFDSLLKAKSHSKFIFSIVGIKKIMVIAGILIALPFGIIAIAISRLVTEVLAFIANLFVYKKEIKTSRLVFLKSILPTLLAAILGGIAAYLFSNYIVQNMHDGLRVMLGTVAGCIVYALSIYLLDKKAVNNFLSFLKR